MKKLLLKLFPSYFNVCQHTYLNLEDIKQPDSALKLVIVDDGTDNTFDKLGITDERGEYIMKEVRKAMIDNPSRIEVMKSLENDLKHMNEVFIAILIMEKEANQGGSPLSGLIMAMMNKPRPDDNGPDGE